MAKLKSSENKLTIEKILTKKKIIEETTQKPYQSDFFGAEIDIEMHSADKVAEILNKQYDTAFRGDLELIYAFCPIFRSKKLQEELEINDPVDTVSVAFSHNIQEISNLAKEIVKRYGFDVNKVEEIKKPLKATVN